MFEELLKGAARLFQSGERAFRKLTVYHGLEDLVAGAFLEERRRTRSPETLGSFAMSLKKLRRSSRKSLGLADVLPAGPGFEV
jgi:hypothetical protein